MLSGTNVALGVTGSIAAVRCVELAHELRRQGASVRAVTTDAAQGVIHPWALEFATDNDVVTEITGSVEHVELCGEDGWADVLLIAPATANTVGKMAAAVDDTPVTTCATTALGAGLPVVVAPAMHEPMYDHPGVMETIDRLRGWGVSFVDPRVEEGKAKVADEEAIVLETARATTDATLAGEHVVVTSGATSERIDPVRVITSRASGRTGRAVAKACYARGAHVTLVHDGPDVPYAEVRQVETAREMLTTVLQTTVDADALVSAAAVSDYTVATPSDRKISSGQDLTLELESTSKIIDEVRDSRPDVDIVGFKLETAVDDDALVESARATLRRAELSFVVANDASVMGEDDTRALIVTDVDVEEYAGSKDGLGDEVAERLGRLLG